MKAAGWIWTTFGSTAEPPAPAGNAVLWLYSVARREPDPEPGLPSSFFDEAKAEDRRYIPAELISWILAFAGLFAGVFFCFWWSGAAIRFGASRVAEKPVATWRVQGTVRSALTHLPVPWAAVEDDAAGRPPFYRTDADQNGAFDLLTLAEPHPVRVKANGYRAATVQVGRQWFIWWPSGAERRDVELAPE